MPSLTGLLSSDRSFVKFVSATVVVTVWKKR